MHGSAATFKKIAAAMATILRQCEILRNGIMAGVPFSPPNDIATKMFRLRRGMRETMIAKLRRSSQTLKLDVVCRLSQGRYAPCHIQVRVGQDLTMYLPGLAKRASFGGPLGIIQRCEQSYASSVGR